MNTHNILIFLICLSSQFVFGAPSFEWNTFYGSLADDYGSDITCCDSQGNIYIIGSSFSTWGEPINKHNGDGYYNISSGEGDYDIVIEKTNSDGEHQWNTFLGALGTTGSDWFPGVGDDYGTNISLDSHDNIIFSATSRRLWGTPLNSASINSAFEGNIIFGKLNNKGEYLWHTYTDSKVSRANIHIDNKDNIYIVGSSDGSWGIPMHIYNDDGGGGLDIVLIKYNNNGEYQWHTFIGGKENDFVYGITSDKSGNIYISGGSYGSWSSCNTALTPHAGNGTENPFSGSNNEYMYVAKLDINGQCQWHTFFETERQAEDVYLDTEDNIYVLGEGDLIKLDNSGEIQGTISVSGNNMKIDISGNIYIASGSLVKKYNKDGDFLWSVSGISSGVISLDMEGNIFTVGRSSNTSGSPLNDYTGLYDIEIIKYAQPNCGTNCAAIPTLPSEVSKPTLPSEVDLSPLERDFNHLTYFLLQIGNPMDIDVSVDYITQDDTAIAGKDYVSTSSVATITAGETHTAIGVEIIGDTVAESDETFNLVITNPKGANFPEGITEIKASKMIVDDDDKLGFRKLDSNGNSLSIGATDWSCVKDNVTGLIWEGKTDAGGLRDKDHTYSWYNSTSVSTGTVNGGDCYNNSNCDTEKYVQQVNIQGLCGATDWRMPTISELESIVGDFPNVFIDGNYFPNTISYPYWSGTQYQIKPDNAWLVDFIDGKTYVYYQYTAFHVRLVRTDQ